MAGSLLLGVDIGTYSAKGVLCTPAGEVLASHVVEHGLSLPRPGWAEQDADAVWWNGFVEICRALVGDRYRAEDIGAVAVSAIGPCLLPVDAEGRPLRPGILYGIDTRAMAEIDWLTAHFGEEEIFELGGMAPDLPGGWSQDPLAPAQRARDLRKDVQDPVGKLVPGLPADRRVRDRSSYRRPLQPPHRHPAFTPYTCGPPCRPARQRYHTLTLH